MKYLLLVLLLVSTNSTQAAEQRFRLQSPDFELVQWNGLQQRLSGV